MSTATPVLMNYFSLKGTGGTGRQDIQEVKSKRKTLVTIINKIINEMAITAHYVRPANPN